MREEELGVSVLVMLSGGSAEVGEFARMVLSLADNVAAAMAAASADCERGRRGRSLAVNSSPLGTAGRRGALQSAMCSCRSVSHTEYNERSFLRSPYRLRLLPGCNQTVTGLLPGGNRAAARFSVVINERGVYTALPGARLQSRN